MAQRSRFDCIETVESVPGARRQVTAAAGSAQPRNDQYAQVLTVLLRRLGDRRAVLVSALVASARMSAVPENERTMLPGDVRAGERH